MIRTVWLAIACLIVLAGLTVLKVSTAGVVQEDAATAEQTAAAGPTGNLVSEVLPKGDRLDAAEQDDAVKPVRPLAIKTRVAAAAPVEATGSDEGWRRSYAKREAASAKHRKGRLHKTSRGNRSYAASRHHGKAKTALTRKHKKSRSRG